MSAIKRSVSPSPDSKMMLVILDESNPEPGLEGVFELRNMGSPQPAGCLYIDANPGELSSPIPYLYQQVGDALPTSGISPDQNFEAFCKAIKIPKPRSFHEIVEKMNENQFLKLGPNTKGICTVPRSRRHILLEYLGFQI